MSSVDFDVIVIGAGAAGLAAGLALMDGGKDVAVFEGNAEAGGNMRAIAQDGALLALGPQAFPSSALHASWLVERAGLLGSVTSPALGSARFIFRMGRLHRLPSGPAGLISTAVLSLRGKLRLLTEPFRSARSARPDESVTSFFSRRIGPEAVNALIGPFVTGIHAADPDTLEARSAFPALVEWERARGSLFAGALAARLSVRRSPRSASRTQPSGRGPSLHSVRGGLSHLARGCASALGDRLHVGTPTLSVHRESTGWRVMTSSTAMRCRHLVLAIPAPEASKLLRQDAPEAARIAGTVPMAPVAVVHLGGVLSSADKARAPGGFGVLVARGEGLRSLGTVFSSSLWPDIAPEGAWLQATYVGGSLDPRSLDLDDDALRALVAQETEIILGFNPDAGVSRVIRHPAGIPQMIAGHCDRIAALRHEVGVLGGLSLAGNWLDGIGLDAAIASGRRAAAEAA